MGCDLILQRVKIIYLYEKEVCIMKPLSNYAVKYDNRCVGWTENKDYNRMFITYQQRYFNDLLRNRGYVFLRDVYESLGIPITKDSCVIGWIFEENNQYGDNFVEFDIRDSDGSNFIIDFNIDGDIIHRI